MTVADFRHRGPDGGFASPTPVERRTPRPAAAGEAWAYNLNGSTVRVTVSVIVPTRNEAANLAELFASLPPVYEVIVVDGHSVDGHSVDGTAEQAPALMPEAKVVVQSGTG